MTTATEQSLERCVDALRAAYMKIRQRWDRRFRAVGSGFNEKARKFAALLLAKEVNPYNYVQFVWDLHARHTGDIYDAMLLSESNLNRYLESRPETEDHLRLLVRLQFNVLERELKSGRQLRDVLVDRHLELSAVFRFAAAWAAREADLCEMFREQAECMLLFEPAYRRLLEHALPEELRRDKA